MFSPEIIHVIDDDEGVRHGLCALLETRSYVVKPHESCEAFLSDLSPHNALCVIADLRLPGMGGLELQDHLMEKAIELPFIVITGHGDVSTAVRALKAGAADFIEKPIDGKLLLAAVEKAAARQRSSRQTSDALARARQKIQALTPRERDVLQHLVEGSPNKIIAHQLGISPRTVENHRARLMDKMQVDSLAELVRMALDARVP